MNKLGSQYIGSEVKESWGKLGDMCANQEENIEIIDVLQKFQAGYVERNLAKTDSFVEELFIEGSKTIVLGTGTQELFLGTNNIKELIKGDWEGWGDVRLNIEKACISSDGNIARFAVPASVKYSFKHTSERYNSYVNYIKNNIEKTDMSAKQKISFLNWALTLTYHQREDRNREYLWSLCISGTMLKQAGKWKIVQLHFSVARPAFPEERLESSKEFEENYRQMIKDANAYETNKMNKKLRSFLMEAAKVLTEEKSISRELIKSYFSENNSPYLIGTQNELYYGIEELTKYFRENNKCKLDLELDGTLAASVGKTIVITAIGKLEFKISEEEMYKNTLEQVNKILNKKITSENKIFGIQRSISYAIKETSAGNSYTCPIRFSGVIAEEGNKHKFHNLHVSFPFYWIFEGKLDDCKFIESAEGGV